MKLAILGTRGIPNAYGGFEQFAEYLSQHMVKLGHDVTVYNSSEHPYQKSIWNDVKIVHANDPEDKLGTAGQFIYDLNCIRDIRKRDFDLILQLGYTSSSIWGWLLPKKSVVVTNMDGLEWKRSKFSMPVQKFLKMAERLAVKWSNFLVADSIGIQNHLKRTYGVGSKYIAYGSNSFESPQPNFLAQYGISQHAYDMLIARLEPENSIEVILDGVVKTGNTRNFLVVGKHETTFGEYLKDKYKSSEHIRFLGGIYDIEVLNNLRYHCNLYFHGHTVGGTNPSLLEAMGSQALICAHKNEFNSYILNKDAHYFSSVDDVSYKLKTIDRSNGTGQDFVQSNLKKIKESFNWESINNQYAKFLQECLVRSEKNA